MKHLLGGAATLALVAGTASADGISRSDLPLSVLFEQGNYAQLSWSHVTPTVSGDYTAVQRGLGAATAGDFATTTGNMALSYSNVGAALKMDLTDRLSLGLFLNQPYGALASYEQGFYSGLNADWSSEQVAAVAKYQINNNFSVYGGLRVVTSSADIAIPDQLRRVPTTQTVNTNLAGLDPTGNGDVANGRAAAQTQFAQLEAAATAAVTAGQPVPAQVQAGLAQLGPLLAVDNVLNSGASLGYEAFGERDTSLGYLLGVAYERPEIALRVALTYESGVSHEFETTESLPGFGLMRSTKTDVDLPQSVRLDFQSGVAKDTLVFGSIEWTEWSVWEVKPPGYAEFTNGQAITGFDNDTWRYQIGVGRRFSDTFSGFARITYEAPTGDDLNRLSPTDGSTAYGIGGTWTNDDVKLTAGIEYVKLGGGETSDGVKFDDNSAIGFGMSLGFNF